MGSFGPEKILLLVLVLVLLFGARRLPELGASLGKGIREFKGSLSGKDEAPTPPPADVTAPVARAATPPVETDDRRDPRRLIP